MTAQTLLNPSWWWIVLLGACGIAGGVFGLVRGAKRMWLAGGALAALAAAWAVAAALVETNVEKAVARTRAIVRSVEARDWATFESLLDPRTSFAIYHDRAQLVEGARRTTDSIGLKTVRILELTPRETGGVIAVDLRLLSEQDATLGRPVPTSWRFNWQERADGWMLQQVEYLPSAQVPQEQVMSRLDRRP